MMFYYIRAKITEFNPSRTDQILTSADSYASWDDWRESENSLTSHCWEEIVNFDPNDWFHYLEKILIAANKGELKLEIKTQKLLIDLE